KWKSHWTGPMLLRDLAKEGLAGLASATAQWIWRETRRGSGWLSGKFKTLVRGVQNGWPWRPAYFRWQLAALRFPSTIGAVPIAISNALRYRRSAMDFFTDSGQELLLRHDLGPQSLVLDVGAYVGDWTGEIVSRYG